MFCAFVGSLKNSYKSIRVDSDGFVFVNTFLMGRESFYVLEIENLILRTVNIDDIYEVARMLDFGKGEISLKEAKKAIEQIMALKIIKFIFYT